MLDVFVTTGTRTASGAMAAMMPGRTDGRSAGAGSWLGESAQDWARRKTSGESEDFGRTLQSFLFGIVCK